MGLVMLASTCEFLKMCIHFGGLYPSYSLDLDLVLEAIGVHLEEFFVVTCRPGTPSKMLKHTSASAF